MNGISALIYKRPLRARSSLSVCEDAVKRQVSGPETGCPPEPDRAGNLT